MDQWPAQSSAAGLFVSTAPQTAARANRRRAQFQTLYATALHLMARLGSHDLPRIVLDHARVLLNMRCGTLYCLGHDGQATLMACTPGVALEDTLARLNGPRLAHYVGARHLPLLIDSANDAALHCGFCDTDDLPTLLGIPLRWMGQAVGAILLVAPAEHTFDMDDFQLPGLFANLATLTLMQNARFYKNVHPEPAASGLSPEQMDDLSVALQAIIQQGRPLCEPCIATMSATERERTRIAHELHDSIRQSLVGVQLQLEAAWSALHQADPAHAAQLLRAGQEALAAADAEMRQVVYDLHTPALIEEGLDVAIRAYAAHWQSVTGLTVSLELSDLTLPAPVAMAFYRIVQEALTNVSRHAQAQQVRISLCHEIGCLRLSIADDGRGGATARVGGMGMTSMRERARTIGATFQLASPPGAGTTITVELRQDL